MRVGVLFSGGKDSAYAAYIAKKAGYDVVCLITIVSKNSESFMFHTPNIKLTEKQSEVMGIPLVTRETEGLKEEELDDLQHVIEKAIKKYSIAGIVTGAVESVYQASRIQGICNAMNIECFNPLWQKNQITLLEELVKNKFEAALSGVFAYPFDKKWLGRRITPKFIEDMKILSEKYKINPAGEGGEFESLVLNCPLFKKPLKIKSTEISGEGNSWRADFTLN